MSAQVYFGAGCFAFAALAWMLWRPAKVEVVKPRACGRSQPFDEVLIAPPAATGSIRDRRRVVAVCGGFTAAVSESLLAPRTLEHV